MTCFFTFNSFFHTGRPTPRVDRVGVFDFENASRCWKRFKIHLGYTVSSRNVHRGISLGLQFM